jgi:hypothetical protein
MGSRKYFNWDWEIGKWSEGESGSHENESATNRSRVATVVWCWLCLKGWKTKMTHGPLG